MANAFDIDKVLDKNGVDQNVDTHLLNETFHVFSKSPASPSTTLGGARLKSGHTTTASDVWADEIPAFFNAATQAKFELFATKAVKDDLCLFNGNVYKHNGTEFVSLGTEADVLVDGATFSKNNKQVVKFHKGRTAINLTPDNNNGDGADNLAAKIYNAATGSTTFVPQFISSTDKMVDGIPSLAYDAAVFAGGSQLAEGLTADNDYICNAYAGVIQFNSARSSGVTVNAWEYIGEKLTATVSDIKTNIKSIETQLGLGEGETTPVGDRLDTIEESLEVLTGADTVEGSIAKSIKDAVEALDVAEATTNGITVSQTDGKISVTVAADTVVTKGSDKVVTSGAVESVTSALDQRVESLENTVAKSADTLSATATSDDTNVTVTLGGTIAQPTLAVTTTGLATDAELESAVATLNAKSLAGTSTGSTLVGVSTTGKVETGLQTITVDTTGLQTELDKAAHKATTISSTSTSTDSNVTVALSGTIGAPEVTVTTTGLATAQELSDAVDALEAKSLASTSTGSEFVKLTATGTVGEGQAIAVDTTAITTEFEKVAYMTDEITATATSSDANVTVTLGGTVAQPTLAVSTTGLATDAELTALSDTVVSSTSTTTEGNVTVTLGGKVGAPTVTVTQSDIASAAGLAALEAKVNKLHETGVSYKVVDTLPAAPTEADKGYVYLVKTGENGESALGGSYLEYIAIEGATEGTFVWEKIGTTAADLTDYVTTIATANGVSGTVVNNVATISVQDGTTAQKGLVQLTDTVVGTDSTLAVTGKAVNTAITTAVTTAVDSLDATVTSTGVDGITLVQTDGKVESVTVVPVTDIKRGTTIATADQTKVVTAKVAQDALNAAIDALDVAATTKHGITYSQTDGVIAIEVATADLVADGAIVESVATGDEDKFVTAAQALEAVKLAKPDNFVASVTGYNGAAQVTTTQGAAVKVLDSRGETVTANDLWATGVSMTAEGTIVVDHKHIEGKGSADLNTITAVHDDKTYVGDAFYSHIQVEMIKDGTSIFEGCSNLATFEGDLSGLVNGTSMFAGTKLASYKGDLKSLETGTSMFAGCTALKSFVADLSALTTGTNMFNGAALESFAGDLSGLTEGTGMFAGCKLDIESVEIIADTLPVVTSGAITIGVAASLVGTEELAALVADIEAKGWTCTIA